MARRRACDYCHEQKQKCIVGKFEKQCEGCEEGGRKCSSTRLRLRPGRQPKIQQFESNVVVDVWDTAQMYGKSILTFPSSGDSGPEDSTATHTSCYDDQPISNSTSTDEIRSSSNLKTLISIIHCSTSRFKYQKEQLFDPDSPEVISRFFTHYEIFILGPSFTIEFRESIKKLYTSSPALLHDIIIELETALPTITSEHRKYVDFATGSSAVKDLRTMHPTCVEHGFTIVGLGQVLAAFDLMTGCIGAESIVRSSLISVNAWIPELLTDSLCASVVIGAIFWDTLYCLFRTEIPVVRYEPMKASAHRIAGLCTTLLPILYDICVANVMLHTEEHHRMDDNTTPLKVIEERLQQWMPTYPTDLTRTFSMGEIVKMETQAFMYRDAAKLLMYRNRHPYGDEDNLALRLARSIVKSLETATWAIGGRTKLNLVSFPVLLAAMEIEDLSRNVWQDIGLSAATPGWVDKACGFVEYVWKQRHSGEKRYLREMVRDGPDIVIIP